MTNQGHNCPLCLSEKSKHYSTDQNREYYLCLNCQLIFVPRDQLVSFEAEERRYSFHENDDGYDSYLANIGNQINNELTPVQKGLDYGCGKTKILELKLHSLGHIVSSYDFYFHPDKSALDEKYDFIILSEVIEHLRDLSKELVNIKNLLNSNGKLFIKTKLHPKDVSKFEKWFYKRDITHIQFFSDEVFGWLQQNFDFKVYKNLGNDLYLLS